MNIRLATLLSLAALSLSAPALAQSQTCPPGTSPGVCLDNAYREIDELQQRVRALEQRVYGTGAPPAYRPAPAPAPAPAASYSRPQGYEAPAGTTTRQVSSKPDKHGCKGGQIFINEECNCPVTKPFWDGEVCRGP